MADLDEQPALAPNTGVGPRLKAARESAGLSLAEMSGQTKIPARMLVLIEAGDFAALPARTYATGFTRTYARVLGLDEKAMVAAVRAELGMHEQVEARTATDFEPGDPSRVPSARFAWLAAVAALAVVAAGMVLWRTYYAPAVVLPPLVEETASAAPPTEAALPLTEASAIVTEAASEAATVSPSVPVRAAPAPRRSAPRVPAAQALPTSPPPLEAAPSPASTIPN